MSKKTKGKIKDRYGKEIRVGCTAMWWDAEEEVLRGPYEVYRLPNEEMACLSDGSSDVECPPSEVIIIEGKNIKSIVDKVDACPFCGSKHIEFEEGGDFNGEDCIGCYTCHSCDSRFGVELY